MKLTKTSEKSIYYVINKNDSISYYVSFKNPYTKKSIRKKIKTIAKNEVRSLTKNKIVLEVKKELEKLKEDIKNVDNRSNIEIEKETTTYENFITLNQLAQKYYKEKIEQKKRKLREFYNHLSNEDFENNNLIQKKVYNVKKEHLRYIKNVETFELGKTPLNKINRKVINNYINNVLGVSNLAQKSKFMIMSNIKTIVNWGIRNEIINISNPFQNVAFKNPKRQRARVLDESELRSLLQKCKEYKENINVYLSVYLGVLTAARARSILTIRKKDIDINNKTITIINQKNNNQVYKVPLSEKGATWLKDKILPFYEDNEYLIKNIHNRKNGILQLNPMVDIPHKVYQIMDELFNQHLNKQNNLDRDDVVNFHTIRRSIGTNLVKNGVSVYNVMILLNHSSVEQTMKYLNINYNKLNSHISGLMDNIFKDF